MKRQGREWCDECVRWKEGEGSARTSERMCAQQGSDTCCCVSNSRCVDLTLRVVQAGGMTHMCASPTLYQYAPACEVVYSASTSRARPRIA